MTTKVEYAVTCVNAGQRDITYSVRTEDMARQIGADTAERCGHDLIAVQRIYHVSRDIVETLAEYRDGQLVEQPARVVPFLRGPFEAWRHNENMPIPDLRDLTEWLRQNADMLEHLQDRQRDVTDELGEIAEGVGDWLYLERERRGAS